MKKIALFVLILIVGLIAFIFHTFSSTGYFRDIEPKHDFGEIFQTINLPGVEDMALARKDSFLILSVDDRAKRRAGEEGLHGLYWLDLRQTPFETKAIPLPTNLTLFPHGISLFEIGPNQYQLAVINHVEGKHSIELFTIQDSEVLYDRTLRDPLLISPNDLVLVGKDKFYYSNDHGNTSKLGVFAENYLGVAAANVGYFDGENFRIVAEDLAYPNGLVPDQSGEKLFVASSRGFLIRAYDIQRNGDLTRSEDISVDTGVDNLEIDDSGTIWTGAHPDLMTFSAYAAGKKEFAPSEILKISYNEGQSKIESVWLDDGKTLSATSVAIPFGDYLFLGNVMDSKFLVLKK
ncbi:SMP-30/gluconolactonase/LRE family protein [Algoriphagus limi]|uniref:SMP-30/gluconolactonase/LRE family protein n=1 Tax=Algoriphagus limi TaxID=2975273 RepID=A0ABT2G783_9BACT|nr:SMP-30/gluconolactonase/LRE family protein [Algoriphagus limi]MCS5490628.1 SMP-30/gluconolactonase/LRE family protein [Algoriphagus limi]